MGPQRRRRPRGAAATRQKQPRYGTRLPCCCPCAPAPRLAPISSHTMHMDLSRGRRPRYSSIHPPAPALQWEYGMVIAEGAAGPRSTARSGPLYRSHSAKSPLYSASSTTKKKKGEVENQRRKCVASVHPFHSSGPRECKNCTQARHLPTT